MSCTLFKHKPHYHSFYLLLSYLLPGRKKSSFPSYTQLSRQLQSHFLDQSVSSVIGQSLLDYLFPSLIARLSNSLNMAKPSAALDKVIDDKIRVAKLDVLAVEKRDWLDNQCKQYENNLKISGLQYSIKDYYGKNGSGRREWRAEIIQRAFIDTNIVDEETLFAKNDNGKKELKRVVRDVHPSEIGTTRLSSAPSQNRGWLMTLRRWSVKEAATSKCPSQDATKHRRSSRSTLTCRQSLRVSATRPSEPDVPSSPPLTDNRKDTFATRA